MEQNPEKSKALGAIVSALRGTHDFASKPFGYNNPPGEAVSEYYLGLPAMANTLDNMNRGLPVDGWEALSAAGGAMGVGQAALPVIKGIRALK